MDINFNTSRLGASFDPALQTGPAVSAGEPEASRNDKGLSVGLAAGTGLDALEELDPAVEAALTRDDDMGRFLDDLFNLAPPPLPAELKT